MSTIAKKQHYVWQHYLKPWTTKGKLFCYMQSAKKLLETNTKAIANETYFYKVEKLSPEDEKYINLLIDKSSSEEMRSRIAEPSRCSKRASAYARFWVPWFRSTKGSF
jgi:hypothetical protein